MVNIFLIGDDCGGVGLKICKVPELTAMTDEEANDYLYHAVHSEEARAFLKKRAEGGTTE